MALVIEDGTIVAGANSFVTRAEIIAYAALRGVTIPDTDASDVYAIRAMDYFWSLPCLKGTLVEADQTTPYPRKGLVDGDTAEGYVYSIPAGIKNAQLQLSLDSFNGIDLTPSVNPEAGVKSEKVGPIATEYFDPLATSLTLDGRPPLTIATQWLAPFVCNAGGFSLVTVRG